MSLFIYLFMCVPVCALITETQGKLFSWNVQMFWWIWRNIQITAFSVVFHLGTVKRPVITSFLPFFTKSSKCSQLHPLQRVDYNLGQCVLGRAQAGQRHHWGLSPRLWALHSSRWWETLAWSLITLPCLDIPQLALWDSDLQPLAYLPYSF